MTTREYPDRPWVGIGVVAFEGPQDGPPGEERVLLVRRGKAPRKGSWSLPGGAQHAGERAEACARRELLEETGIEVGPLELAAVFDSISRDAAGAVQYHYTIIDFCGLRVGGEARPGDDVDAVAWALPEELPAYDLTPDALKVIAEARARLLPGRSRGVSGG